MYLLYLWELPGEIQRYKSYKVYNSPPFFTSKAFRWPGFPEPTGRRKRRLRLALTGRGRRYTKERSL
jgi:hypothetical protein